MPIAGAIGELSDKADRPESPVPSGFRRNGLICFVARLANSTNYSLRRGASHLKPLRSKRDSCGTCSEVPQLSARAAEQARLDLGVGGFGPQPDEEERLGEVIALDGALHRPIHLDLDACAGFPSTGT